MIGCAGIDGAISASRYPTFRPDERLTSLHKYASFSHCVNARSCRVAGADWRPGRVYFLTLLEPLAGTTGLWPLPPGRPVPATVGELNPTVDWFPAK